MHQIPLSQYPKEALNFLLSGIAFIRTLQANNPVEADLVLGSCHLYEAERGEQLITRGETVKELYFLLRGQLLIYPDDETDDATPVSIVSPGQVIGALELAADHDATGSVAVDENVGRALLLGIKHEVFGRALTPGLVSDASKVALLRLIANNARWRIDQYRSRYPECQHGQRMNEIPLAPSHASTREQLHALVAQCQAIAGLLRDWKAWLRDQEDNIPTLREVDHGQP